MHARRLQGIISMTRRGIGYVTPEGGGVDDIEISKERCGTALHRDVVLIELLPKKEKGRTQGVVIRVIERARQRFVGTLSQKKGVWSLSPDNSRISVNFEVSARPGVILREEYKAQMEMQPWDDATRPPQGVVLRVLGIAGAMSVERSATALEHGFDTQFPEKVLGEARRVARERQITKNEIALRRDLRPIPTMTIDPDDAKDFDDALSVEMRPDGAIEVGIHIADVSHYVRPGSLLDDEAQKRGTSVYMVGETVPMLPETLSNDLCSLNPDEEKLTFSAIFILSSRGEIINEWFGRTVISSKKRFSYEEAQRVIDSREGPFAQELGVLNELARILRRGRMKHGAIDFDTDEVRIKLDEAGDPVAIEKKERLDTHKLVEEFMLLANRKVAEYVFRKTKGRTGGGSAFVYRVHDVPDRDKLEELSVFLKAIGYDLQKKKGPISSREINTLFKEIAGKPEEELIKIATIRTMAKAVYTTKNIGHFGLAFRYYTHFTSPIRRYPDIMVHRLLGRYLSNEPVSKREYEEYKKLALRSSMREMEAVEAERESIKYAQVRYMEPHVGKEFDAVVSGVTSWGMYVAEVDTRAEGLIRLASLSDDYYHFDKKSYSIIGEKTKQTYTLGDAVRVRLVAADPQEKTLDFALVESASSRLL